LAAASPGQGVDSVAALLEAADALYQVGWPTHAWTVLQTGVEPLVIYDAGFQLTVLATFGLPLLVPPIQRALAAPFRALPGAVVVAELLAVTVAAQLATLPVLAVRGFGSKQVLIDL